MELRNVGSLAHPAPLEVRMTTIKAKSLSLSIAILALAPARSLHAQVGIGTWVKQDSTARPGGLTMKVEACCHGGRRLTYSILIDTTSSLLTVESPFDGTEVPVLLNGKPTGETMAIKRVDDHHVSTVLKMNGKFFGTSTATLSADGRTLTVLNDVTAVAGGQTVGKRTEIWVRK
jgi:hypothetical protein